MSLKSQKSLASVFDARDSYLREYKAHFIWDLPREIASGCYPAKPACFASSIIFCALGPGTSSYLASSMSKLPLP